MTLQTNSFTSYSAFGNREDLTNVIYNISPSETPFMTAIGKSKAKAVKHEWQTDTLTALSLPANGAAQNAQFASVAYLRPVFTTDLAKTGDSTRKDMRVEYTLEMRNEGAFGVVADLNAAS